MSWTVHSRVVGKCLNLENIYVISVQLPHYPTWSWTHVAHELKVLCLAILLWGLNVRSWGRDGASLSCVLAGDELLETEGGTSYCITFA